MYRVIANAFRMVCVFGLFAVGSGAANANSAMKVGGLTSQPIGHYEFCQKYPRECLVRSRDHGPLAMTTEVWRLVNQINSMVNRKVMPMNDADIYGKNEHWAFPRTVGDCEDYVLLKRKLLMDRGISASNLLITVVRKPDGEGHAVLTVRTDRGDFVMDNLQSEIKGWRGTGYTYLKRQASTHSGRWVSIGRGSAPVAYSSTAQKKDLFGVLLNNN